MGLGSLERYLPTLRVLLCPLFLWVSVFPSHLSLAFELPPLWVCKHSCLVGQSC